MTVINNNFKCVECDSKAICKINGTPYCEAHSVTRRNKPGIRIQYFGQARRRTPKR
jgi:hypothetical protein